MDIGSNGNYPGSALSNFAAHDFYIDGVYCASMEGFLQSLKHKDPNIQVHICSLVGIGAKKAGGTAWKRRQCLYWKGVKYPRRSKEYQDLLDRAYNELFKNEGFRKALRATGTATLTHSVGKHSECDTCLTVREFCSRLNKLRDRLFNEGL